MGTALQQVWILLSGHQRLVAQRQTILGPATFSGVRPKLTVPVDQVALILQKSS